jgi:hypothetical protein
VVADAVVPLTETGIAAILVSSCWSFFFRSGLDPT